MYMICINYCDIHCPSDLHCCCIHSCSHFTLLLNWPTFSLPTHFSILIIECPSSRKEFGLDKALKPIAIPFIVLYTYTRLFYLEMRDRCLWQLLIFLNVLQTKI